MGFKIKINCDEATTICDKNQYGESSVWDKIKLNIHLVICKYCKMYSSQNKIITRIFGKHTTPCDGLNKLTIEEKQILEKEFSKKREI